MFLAWISLRRWFKFTSAATSFNLIIRIFMNNIKIRMLSDFPRGSEFHLLIQTEHHIIILIHIIFFFHFFIKINLLFFINWVIFMFLVIKQLSIELCLLILIHLNIKWIGVIDFNLKCANLRIKARVWSFALINFSIYYFNFILFFFIHFF